MTVTTYITEKNPEYLLIQPVDDHDLEVIDTERRLIEEMTEQGFVLVCVKVDDWNTDLTPWPAEPVFGSVPFGEGAAQTLQYIKEELLPELTGEYGSLPVILGGYSLAGLFALWSGYESAGFFGIAAASPSVWYPGFNEYGKNRKIQADYVYLSLGDKESRSRNPIMRTVGEEITILSKRLAEELGSDRTVFQWNPGNHFVDSDSRMAKAFAWIMMRGRNNE